MLKEKNILQMSSESIFQSEATNVSINNIYYKYLHGFVVGTFLFLSKQKKNKCRNHGKYIKN